MDRRKDVKNTYEVGWVDFCEGETVCRYGRLTNPIAYAKWWYGWHDARRVAKWGPNEDEAIPISLLGVLPIDCRWVVRQQEQFKMAKRANTLPPK